MNALKLYVDSQLTSTWAMSVFVALQEKGLPFSLHTLDLDWGEQHDRHFSALSLTQRVPTLVHGHFSLSESTAILEYLDEVFPEHLLYPRSIEQRAVARQIQAWVRSDLQAIRQERPTTVIFYAPEPQPLSEAALQAAQKLFVAADRLLAHGGEHLFDAWCIADLDLALMLKRLIVNGDAVPPHLVEYAQRQWARPSAQLWVNQPRPALQKVQ